jgi:hypothetical protein
MPRVRCRVAAAAQSELERFKEVVDEAAVDEEVGTMVKTLWADAGIQAAFQQRNKFQLHDSAP